MTGMSNPPHPAAILREDILPALNLSVTEAASQLGVSRVMLSRLLNEHAAITPEMALRIEQWLGVERGGRADLWLGMQLDYDLWQARKHAPRAVRRAPVEASGRPADNRRV
ncbi:HigA family addiction module antitoxin [Paraburkholderia sp. NPDC080076]|uniref:HigA family addiction module antitoxin n=1 Tax=Paraburkholderia sp. NPDC080076 TaxID=3390605 RepID=UPI003CFFD01E